MLLESDISTICERAHEASRQLANLGASEINYALQTIADQLEADKTAIQDANQEDLNQADSKGVSPALQQRLKLDDKTFRQMVDGVRQVVALSCPVGEVIRAWERPNGLQLQKVRVPIGVIGIIYESRPNVTVDAAVLCLKAGNATVLRGGSEAIHSNLALAESLRRALLAAGLPQAAISLIPTTDRAAITQMCHQSETLDLIIPRGGEGLIRTVTAEALMPVIKHYNGICHIFIHEAANPEMASRIVVNAKCQKPAVCNALETLLIGQRAMGLLPNLARALAAEGVEMRADEEALVRLQAAGIPALAATETDWTAEYLEKTLAIRTVANLDAAVAHIHRYGSAHTDAIVTEDAEAAAEFMNRVDSASVIWNASTRFADGFEYGFGAEIGISTDKLHARGPMGIEELTSYKYLVKGNGQTRT